MRRRILTAASAALLTMMSAGVQAGQIIPFSSCLNLNGAIHDIAPGCFIPPPEITPTAAPGNVADDIEVDLNAADSGLGSVEITLSDVGDFFIGLWVDWEINEGLNFFFDEGAGQGGTLAAGQSFEVDEPGWVDHDDPDFYGGDLDSHFLSSALDGSVLQNANAGDSGGLEEDIALVLGWNFSLAAGQSAIVRFLLAETQPDSGFWLSHSDVGAEVTFFYSSTMEILGNQPPPTAVPEPGTLFLLGAALLGMRQMRRSQTTPI